MLQHPSPPAGRSPRRLGLVEVGVALTLVLLLWHAALYAFLTDDAYISFRYARNLAHGHGLVFNPGFERVEGYTNFLWVLLLAGFDVLGITPETSAHVLSLAATVVLWGLVVWFAARTPPPPGRRWLLLVAPLFLASTRSVAVWSTSGLETRLFEVLVVGGTLRLAVEVESRLAGSPRREFSGVLFALATLTRPDGLLIGAAALGCAGLWLAILRRLDRRALAIQLGLFAAIVLGHYAFRLAYYGYPFPNTYYSKVAGRTWWDMGLLYFALFVLEYAAYLWIPLLGVALRRGTGRDRSFVPWLFTAVVVPHAIYIMSIGGDHFEYRPLDLYFPFLFLLMYTGACRLARGRLGERVTAAYLVAVLVGLVALPFRSHVEFPRHYLPAFPGGLFDPEESLPYMRPEEDPIYRLPGLRRVAAAWRGILDKTSVSFVGLRQEEHELFLSTVLSEGRMLRRLIDDGVLSADTHLAISCVGAIPYYSDLRVLDRHGLTDAVVAHSDPVEQRIRGMAHDKLATFEQAREAGVDLWAWDPVHTVIHVSHPRLNNLITVLTSKHPHPVYLADVGDGYFMMVSAPQGIDAVRRRLPGLEFLSLDAPAGRDLLIEAGIRYREAHLREHPEDHRARVIVGDLLMFTGKVNEAIQAWETVLREKGETPYLWLSLAVAHRRLEQHDQALRAAMRGLELARETGEENMARRLESLLALYVNPESLPPAGASPRPGDAAGSGR